MDDNYKKREIDNFMEHIKKELCEIKKLATATNGKVRNHTKVLLVVGAILGTLLTTNGSDLVRLFKAII